MEGRGVPVQQHPPLTWGLAVAVALRMAVWGYPNAGIGVLLGHDCLLRIMEMLRLQTAHISHPEDPRFGFENKRMFLRMKKTKKGLNQDVDVMRPEVCKLVKWWMHGKAENEESLGPPRSD